MTPRLPTGDGEVMSRSAPLEGWSFFIARDNALQELITPSTLHVDQTTGTGDGEHLSPPEPVGGPHLGSGAKPQFRRRNYGPRAPPLSLLFPRDRIMISRPLFPGDEGAMWRLF